MEAAQAQFILTAPPDTLLLLPVKKESLYFHKFSEDKPCCSLSVVPLHI